MHVHVVDPSAYTPPYDHALCAALGRAGVRTTLFTSPFVYGPVARPDGYDRVDLFYRSARGPAGSSVRQAIKLTEHVPDMLRYRHVAEREADIVHFQWLTVQQLDGHLLPRRRPRVLTAHDVLPREPRRGQIAAQRRLYERFDAVVVHSEHGRRRLVEEAGVDAERVHVIEHGAMAHLAEQPPLPSPFETDRPVVLFFGLLRPYKGLDVLLEAWRGIEDAELWIVGMPRMDVAPLQASAPENVRWVTRFVPDSELPAYFAHADLVVLPYREIDQSGVLFTALAFGLPLLVSDVGGFGEVAAQGAAQLVAPGDAGALHTALRELLADPAARERLAAAAQEAAGGPYSWDAVAVRTIALYDSLLRENPRS